MKKIWQKSLALVMALVLTVGVTEKSAYMAESDNLVEEIHKAEKVAAKLQDKFVSTFPNLAHKFCKENNLDLNLDCSSFAAGVKFALQNNLWHMGSEKYSTCEEHRKAEEARLAEVEKARAAKAEEKRAAETVPLYAEVLKKK